MKLFCWHRLVVFGQVRTLFLSAAVLVCVLGLSLLIGCDKVERHKMLTIFFDGVPPLDMEHLDPNSPEYAEQVKKLEAVSKASRHGSGKDCKHCHEGGILNKPIPELCYTCHDNYSKHNIYVHAPVLVGDCLFCHRAHESSNPVLLKNKIPDLCYKCHDRKAVVLIENHDNEKYNLCSGCHSSHATSNRFLLKGGSRTLGFSAEKKESTPEISEPNAVPENSNYE